MHAPGPSCLRISADVHEARVLTWQEGHAKTVQGNVQAIADSLDVRLLACPGRKKGLVPGSDRHAEKIGGFLAREEVRRQVIHVGKRMDRFHVNPYLTSGGEREDGHLARMGLIEAQVRVRRPDIGFATRFVLEFDVRPGNPKVLRQQSSRRPVCEEECAPQMLEPELLCSLRFLHRGRHRTARHVLIGSAQLHTPDMNLLA